MPALQTLLRLLFPSWAFFDAATIAPRLEVRWQSSARPDASWHPAIVAPPRRWWHVLFNPHGTRVLAEQTVLERYLIELGTEPGALSPVAHVQRRESEQLVGQLAACAMARIGRDEVREPWEWRVIDATDNALLIAPRDGAHLSS